MVWTAASRRKRRLPSTKGCKGVLCNGIRVRGDRSGASMNDKYQINRAAARESRTDTSEDKKTMPAFKWWVDEPLVIGSSNPSDEELGRLRAQGFGVAVSLLEENKQPPRYDKKSAEGAGWSL